MALHPAGELVSDVIARTGLWEPVESALWLRLLQPGDRVVDAGANLGYYTRLAAQRVGPSGRVYAFEPDPGNFVLLRDNTAGVAGIDIRQQALGARPGRAGLAQNPENRGDSYLSGDGDVEVVTGDSLQLQRLDVLKIDVQGTEVDVLEGFAASLDRAGPALTLLVELWPFGLARCGRTADALVDRLLRLALPIYRIDHQTGALLPLTAAALRELANRTLDVAHQGFVNLLLTDRLSDAC